MAETKNILLLGNGFVAGPCLTHLLKRPEYHVTVASRHLASSQELCAGQKNTTAIELDVNDSSALEACIAKHHLVISLIPYTYHALVIDAAIKQKKHVVTTSYISPAMKAYDQAAKDAGITVFNEVGVDPGVDHFYAIKTIDDVHKLGGKIVSFLSYCGGLPAPECSNNPLGYKFSWSSRGVLLALRNDAKYWKDGVICETPGVELMDIAKPIYIYPAFAFEGYPNRDSSPYTERYNIPECKNLIRGTLRYQGFPKFVKVLVSLGFLNDAPVDYLDAKSADIEWRSVLAKMLGVAQVDESYYLLNSDLSNKQSSRRQMSKPKILPVLWLVLNGTFPLTRLGLFSSVLVHRRGNFLDTLCATMDEKMQYEEGERDMVMLQHKFGIEYPNGSKETRTSTGLWFGVPGGESAMARTVGVPCAITVQLILDGVITQRGVLAPMTRELVDPIMKELEACGISMVEQIL